MDRALSIVHVVSSLELGGQERVVLDLARGLAGRGHRVTVVSLSDGGALRPLFGNIPTVTMERGTWRFDAPLLLRLRRLFRELKPDAVHTHNPMPLVYAVPAARAAGVARVVHTKHGANPNGVLAARKLLYRMCDRVVAVSPETADVARHRERVPVERLRMIPNGIEIEAYARQQAARTSVRSELGVPEKAVLFGTVGRLAPEKNQKLLLTAAVEIAGPEAQFVVIGDGPLRAELEASVPEQVQPYVHFLGARWDVPTLLSALDVFVLTSTTEGLPLVVPEAMAAGLPVVCTAVGGLPSVVADGLNGKLVPSGSKEALVRALVELRTQPELRARMGQTALCAARDRFALGRMVDAYEAIYRER